MWKNFQGEKKKKEAHLFLRMNIVGNTLVCTQVVLGHQVPSDKLCLHKQGLPGAGDLNSGAPCQGKGTRGTQRTGESLRLEKTFKGMMMGEFWGKLGLFFKTVKYCCRSLAMSFLQVATSWTLPSVSVPSVRPLIWLIWSAATPQPHNTVLSLL